MNLNKDNYTSVNLYFQDESRFGMMTHIGRYLTAKGVKPIVEFKQNFQNTYLYGSYSPVDGDSFVCELENTNSKIFGDYLSEFSKHRPEEFKIVVIDNAGFHATKNIQIPDNIFLLRIPSYTPELNPCEQIWAYMKQRFKNKCFDNLEQIKQWLDKTVNSMSNQTIKSIVGNQHYLDNLNATFNF